MCETVKLYGDCPLNYGCDKSLTKECCECLAILSTPPDSEDEEETKLEPEEIMADAEGGKEG